MKLKKRVFDIFNLSFLDIISCGFGAVLLLVLISKSADDSTRSKAAEVENLLDQLHLLERSIEILAKDIELQNLETRDLEAENIQLDEETQQLTQHLAAKKRQEEALEEDFAGLSLVQATLQRVTITPATSETARDEEVGGIPVDSDYVVFVVDTSGSMQSIWDRVSREIINVLSIHPTVKGFQILNDQGKPLVSGYKGRWIPDTRKRRESVMQVFRSWQDASNSSPLEGIETALRIYAKEGQSTAIYVFGDDYTGSSYDQAVNAVTTMNRRQANGRRLAKIHGVGFLSGVTTGRFAILMREITKRNGGTFLALPI